MQVPAEEADILTNLLSELSGIETSCAQGDVAGSANEYKVFHKYSLSLVFNPVE